MATALVTPERILKDLSELWVSLGKQDESGVVRACAMTLIVATEETEDAGAVGETLAELIHDHPSRAIVLRIRESAEPLLESRVLAQCWMPFGKRQQICCEQIEITSSDASLADVQRILMGVVAPDLPIVLVCRSLRLISLPAFQVMLPMATKVITDSGGSTEPRSALARVRGYRAAGQEVVDLAWTRITRLRQSIASAFDQPGLLSQVSRISRIVISHNATRTPAEAIYLAAWLRRGLGSPMLEIEFYSGEPGEIVSKLEMTGKGLHIIVQRLSATMIEVTSGGRISTSHVIPMSAADLLQEELSITARDRVYDEVLALASP